MEILTKDTDVYYNTWCTSDKPVAALQIFHGMSEHIMRYDDFAKFLSSRGVLVYGMDVRGHGRTGEAAKSLGHFADDDGWNKVISDQRDLFLKFKSAYSDIPFILLGHSMGSFYARDYINRFRDDFDACIAMGTGKADDPSYNAARFILKLLNKKAKSVLIHSLAFGGYTKSVKHRKTIFDWLSTDETQVKKYIDDKFCGIPMTNGFYRDFMYGMKSIAAYENNLKVKIPVLFISGEDDPVGNMGKHVREVYDKYNNVTKSSLILYNGMRHEILNEKDNRKVYENIAEWIKSVSGIN